MTTLQKRRLSFWLGLLAICTLFFLLFPWKAVPVILFFLIVFLSGPLEELYKLVVHQPVSTPEYQPSSQSDEYSPYDQGYQEVTDYQPSMPKEEPVTDDAPQAQYPQQTYR